MSKERGILFGPSMVRALLAGAKTQTRRAMKLREFGTSETKGYEWTFRDKRALWNDVSTELLMRKFCPYGMPGDRLWVRETWRTSYNHEAADAAGFGDTHIGPCYEYAADKPDPGKGWRPSIFMFRRVSRITLEVTEVRVQRLWEISEEDARAEGLSCLSKDGGQTFKWGVPDRDGLPGQDDDGEHWQKWSLSARAAYARLWDSINGAGSWLSNPWVWALSFRRLP